MIFFDWIINIFKIWRGVFSLLFCFFITALLLNMSEAGKVIFYEVAISTVLAPVHSVLGIKDKYFKVYKENRRLNVENMALSIENSLLKENKAQNHRLKEMLNFKDQGAYTLLSGEIIARNPGRYETSWMINLGSSDSIGLNMAVLTPQGVVGKISKVFIYQSIVQIVKDPACKISVRNKRSRVVGILESHELNYIVARFPTHMDVQMEDTLVTSGLGGVFPKGIPVGIILDANYMLNEVIRGVLVELFQNPSLAEEIFVLKQEPSWEGFKP